MVKIGKIAKIGAGGGSAGGVIQESAKNGVDRPPLEGGGHQKTSTGAGKGPIAGGFSAPVAQQKLGDTLSYVMGKGGG